MSITLHSPTPWRWDDGAPDNESMGRIRDANNQPVCGFGYSTQFYPVEGTPPEPPDLAFLLRAVNAHAVLGQTLTDVRRMIAEQEYVLVSRLQGRPFKPSEAVGWDSELRVWRRALLDIDAALALARGEREQP